ncbi:hypothetical protein HYH03_017346 [Edaphochlamys debaryana]|uniref:Uncharacterized protein n=1 Tax=Edaphochlamys debaryana TaxID=47281 RepID=A0A836BQP8_9CHLO|nr:hypothetical protein HYH03_017346 [Edaphochlamys debaryana]|eukprot:KAG2483823.1 hypothetical protein HYH03_017346 [Edaphochlamys debaryana]
MGEIVPISKQGASSDALAVTLLGADPVSQEEYEERIKKAAELEAKLKYIQETVPTKVYNVSSSSAGAGSGDFHQYRIVRRAEQDRVRKMDADFAQKQREDEFKRKLDEMNAKHDEKTAKKRLKRQKKKQQKKAKKEGEGEGAAGAGKESEDSGSEDGAQPALD